MKIFIIGANGFIGSHLSRRILGDTNWQVIAIDKFDNNIGELLTNDRFTFHKNDITESFQWITEQIGQCDVVFPLAAIAQPKLYGEAPLKVFELDFEENLKVIRLATKLRKWLIFPSTSEVYGISTDATFSEDSTNFVYGPTHRIRWIYAGSKQLLDRLIFVLGRDENLEYTIFRPFNWIGPRLDSLESARQGYSRALPQFFANLIDGVPIELNNGGAQKRSFTDIDDGINALMAILNNRSLCQNQIFNIGNPKNECTIADLAELSRQTFSRLKGVDIKSIPDVQDIDPEAYYGANSGFQEIDHRVPDITKITDTLNWYPAVDLKTTIENCASFYLGLDRGEI